MKEKSYIFSFLTFSCYFFCVKTKEVSANQKVFFKKIELLSEQDLERFERLRRFTLHRYVLRKFLSVVVMMVRYLCI
jgi:hypothetical protein